MSTVVLPLTRELIDRYASVGEGFRRWAALAVDVLRRHGSRAGHPSGFS